MRSGLCVFFFFCVGFIFSRNLTRLPALESVATTSSSSACSSCEYPRVYPVSPLPQVKPRKPATKLPPYSSKDGAFVVWGASASFTYGAVFVLVSPLASADPILRDPTLRHTPLECHVEDPEEGVAAYTIPATAIMAAADLITLRCRLPLAVFVAALATDGVVSWTLDTIGTFSAVLSDVSGVTQGADVVASIPASSARAVGASVTHAGGLAGPAVDVGRTSSHLIHITGNDPPTIPQSLSPHYPSPSSFVARPPTSSEAFEAAQHTSIAAVSLENVMQSDEMDNTTLGDTKFDTDSARSRAVEKVRRWIVAQLSAGATLVVVGARYAVEVAAVETASDAAGVGVRVCGVGGSAVEEGGEGGHKKLRLGADARPGERVRVTPCGHPAMYDKSGGRGSGASDGRDVKVSQRGQVLVVWWVGELEVVEESVGRIDPQVDLLAALHSRVQPPPPSAKELSPKGKGKKMGVKPIPFGSLKDRFIGEFVPTSRALVPKDRRVVVWEDDYVHDPVTGREYRRGGGDFFVDGVVSRRQATTAGDEVEGVEGDGAAEGTLLYVEGGGGDATMPGVQGSVHEGDDDGGADDGAANGGDAGVGVGGGSSSSGEGVATPSWPGQDSSAGGGVSAGTADGALRKPPPAPQQKPIPVFSPLTHPPRAKALKWDTPLVSRVRANVLFNLLRDFVDHVFLLSSFDHVIHAGRTALRPSASCTRAVASGDLEATLAELSRRGWSILSVQGHTAWSSTASASPPGSSAARASPSGGSKGGRVPYEESVATAVRVMYTEQVTLFGDACVAGPLSLGPNPFIERFAPSQVVPTAFMVSVLPPQGVVESSSSGGVEDLCIPWNATG